MKAKWLPAVLTPLKPEVAMRAIRGAWETLEGVTPSVATMALLMAQSALETWRWQTIYGNCFGNEKASAVHEGFYQCYRCNEQLSDGWHWYIPEGELVGKFGTPLKGAPLPVPEGHPQTRFKAFQSAELGALEWLRLIKRRYPEAYQIAKDGGTAVGFVHALKLRRYFTANEGPYALGVTKLVREFTPIIVEPNRDTQPVPPDPDEDEQMLCTAMACVAPDPERALHNEATVAMMLGQEGMWDAVREERNRNLADE